MSIVSKVPSSTELNNREDDGGSKVKRGGDPFCLVWWQNYIQTLKRNQKWLILRNFTVKVVWQKLFSPKSEILGINETVFRTNKNLSKLQLKVHFEIEKRNKNEEKRIVHLGWGFFFRVDD